LRYKSARARFGCFELFWVALGLSALWLPVHLCINVRFTWGGTASSLLHACSLCVCGGRLLGVLLGLKWWVVVFPPSSTTIPLLAPWQSRPQSGIYVLSCGYIRCSCSCWCSA
jgi:hypothetical protein